jgi:hypothetical protein
MKMQKTLALCLATVGFAAGIYVAQHGPIIVADAQAQANADAGKVYPNAPRDREYYTPNS